MEQRLIDADKLEYRVMTECNPFGKPTLEFESGIKVMGMIEDAPTIDAVQVVRCRECKYATDAYPYDEEDELIPSNAVFCQHFEVIRDKEWYCADGARNENDDVRS